MGWGSPDLHHSPMHVQIQNGGQVFRSAHGVQGWSPPGNTGGLAAAVAGAGSSSSQGHLSRVGSSDLRGPGRGGGGVQAIFADLVTSLNKEDLRELTEQLARHLNSS